MSEDEVIKLMKSSKTEKEWNDNCDKVKDAFGGNYPSFWFFEILLSGLANEIMSTWTTK